MNKADLRPILPPELVDIIIDNLHGEKKSGSLSACSLVARSWLARSHYHLLHTTTFEKDDFRPYSDTAQLLETSSSIRTNIRVLRVWTVSACVAPETLARVLDALENLHTLCIYGMTCTVAAAGGPAQWQRTRRLRRLELSGFDALRAEIVNTLAFFCRVPVGALLVSDWEVLPISLHQALHTIPAAATLDGLLCGWPVDAVVFSHNVSRPALDLVQTACIPERVRSIDVAEQLLCSAVPRQLNQLLGDVGRHLTHLRLDVTGIYTQPSILSIATALSQCTTLESLHLYLGAHVFYDRFASVDSATASFPLALMSDIPSSIQHITLGFGIDYEGEFVKFWAKKVDWSSLERRLLSMAHLKSVHFIWEIPYPAVFEETRVERLPSSTRDLIAKSLPQLHALDRLVL